MPYFFFKFYFSRRRPNIFYMLFEKSYDIFLGFLGETIWKYLENFPHFLFKNFQTYSYGIISWKYWELLLSLYSNMAWFCFFALVYTLNHTFWNETTVWQKSIKALFYSELKKMITLKLAKLVSQPIHRVKFNKLNSWKKNISFDVLKFRFFRVF
jgi:hypothetical protein